jgi:hypothetical protein
MVSLLSRQFLIGVRLTLLEKTADFRERYLDYLEFTLPGEHDFTFTRVGFIMSDFYWEASIASTDAVEEFCHELIYNFQFENVFGIIDEHAAGRCPGK